MKNSKPIMKGTLEALSMSPEDQEDFRKNWKSPDVNYQPFGTSFKSKEETDVKEEG